MTQMEQIQPCVALFKWGLCRSRCASRSHEADNSSRLLLMSFRVRDRTRYRMQPRPARRCTFRLDAGTRSSLPPSATNRHCRRQATAARERTARIFNSAVSSTNWLGAAVEANVGEASICDDPTWCSPMVRGYWQLRQFAKKWPWLPALWIGCVSHFCT